MQVCGTDGCGDLGKSGRGRLGEVYVTNLSNDEVSLVVMGVLFWALRVRNQWRMRAVVVSLW